jgi:hypothetical protein
MSSEILKHLAAATEAAAEKMSGAEADGAVARDLLDDLAAAGRSAVRTLPPDNSDLAVGEHVDVRSLRLPPAPERRCRGIRSAGRLGFGSGEGDDA